MYYIIYLYYLQLCNSINNKFIFFIGDIMKIGIPRSLYYYYYDNLWINFFKFLNVDVLVSPLTNKEIMDLGIKYAQDEMCLSMKNYIGHIAYLKDKCDYILIPRLDNYGRDNQTCTNFLAVYDIINNLFDINILNYNINLLNKETEKDGFIKIGTYLGFSKNKSIFVYILCIMAFSFLIIIFHIIFFYFL